MTHPSKSAEEIARELRDVIETEIAYGLSADISNAIAAAIKAARAEAIEECANTAAAHTRMGCGCDQYGAGCSDRCLGRDDGHEQAASDIYYKLRALARDAKDGGGRDRNR